MTCVLTRTGDQEIHVREHKENTATCKTSREASEETTPVDTLILEFKPLELYENGFLLFKPPSLRDFLVLWQP